MILSFTFKNKSEITEEQKTSIFFVTDLNIFKNLLCQTEKILTDETRKKFISTKTTYNR